MSSMAAGDKHRKTGYLIAFVLYLILLFYLLFFSEKMGRTVVTEQYRYNLTLFREIKRFYNLRYAEPKMFLLNIFGNVAAFVPFGYLVPHLKWRSTSFFFTALFSFELSLCVELLQLVCKLGCFDVDDLLLNTLGGMLGYLIYRITHYFNRRKKRHVS
jgi:glycopeptide antibiotics resistance protein